MYQDTSNRYGSITRFFHWVVALLVLQQFFKFADRINDGEHWLGDTFGHLHSGMGVIILALVLLRLLWTWKQRRNRPVNTGVDGLIANAVHGVIYFCLLAMPFLGALYIHGKGYAVKIFGMEILAKPAGEVDWALALGVYHSPLAFLLIVLVLGHIAAAIYHHCFKKDDVLKRML
jgi:cytochrome b561